MTTMRRCVATALACAGLVAAGCGGGGGDEPDVPLGPPTDPVFGFNDNAVRAGLADPGRAAALARRAGAQVVRLTFDWRFAERTRGAYDFGVYDRIYAALRRQGIKPLWTVMFAPQWAWAPGAQCSGDCRLPPGPQATGSYGRLLARIARRYPRSAGIEVWNEPNLKTFWQPEPDPAAYARLLRAGYAAVKRAAPGMPVAGGAVSNNMQSADGNVAAEEFLDAMYRGGAAGAMDALSFHPYSVSRSEPLMLRSVGQVLRARDGTGRGRPRALWVTELGATTTGPDPDLRFSEREQAETLREDFCRLARVPGVRMILVHTLLAPQSAPSSPEAGYGVLRPDQSPRPAAPALTRAARRGC